MFNKSEISCDVIVRNALLLAVSLILIVSEAQAQTDSTRMDSVFYFNARLIDSQSRAPVKFAHVVNTSMGSATISDSLGYFYISGAAGHEIQVSAIGYTLSRFLLSDSILNIWGLQVLKIVPYVYPIGSVSINPLGNYKQFRLKFLELVLPEPKYTIPTSVIKDIDLGVETIRNLSPQPIAYPVSYFYNLWSKEGKSKRKLASLIREEEFSRGIEHKYSPLIVSKVSGYEGKELYEFIDFCNFSKKFLRESIDYEIRKAIKDKKDIFENLHRD